MIPQEDRDETPGVQRKAPRMGATRTPLHLVFQACVGVIIGIGLVSLLSGIAPAQVALIGVIIAVLVWIVEQGIRLPEPNTKRGVRVRLILRLISLVGFTLAVSQLMAMIEGR